MYYEQGNPKKFVVPDVFVVRGVPPGDRRVYKLWVERKPPNVVLEVTSCKTKKKDTVDKPMLYAQLQIEQLGLRLHPEGGQLIFTRLDTGERLLSPEEARLEAEQAQAAAEQARAAAERARATTEEALRVELAARREAEAEVARLRKELRRRSDA